MDCPDQQSQTEEPDDSNEDVVEAGDPELAPLPPLSLNLDNFDIPSAVPENCPYVLTSPRSLEACRILGIQPVELLPVSLSDYEKAFASLEREEVLSVWREVESEREDQLELARRVRRQLAGIVAEPRHSLSPIVEVGGRDSAVGNSDANLTEDWSDSANVSGQDDSAIADCDKWGRQQSSCPYEEDPEARASIEVGLEVEEEMKSSAHVYRSISVPTLIVTQSDQPEVDQHFGQAPDDIGTRRKGSVSGIGSRSSVNSYYCGQNQSDSWPQVLSTASGHLDGHLDVAIPWDQFSESSQESELANLHYTPSPVFNGIGESSLGFSSFSSFPASVEVDIHRDRVGRCYSEESECSQDVIELPGSHVINQNIQSSKKEPRKGRLCCKNKQPPPPLQLSSSAKRCVSSTIKKKAARKTRLTSESVSSLYTPSEDEAPEAERGEQRRKSPIDNTSLLHTVVSRSEVDFSKIELTRHECRILEILAFKRYQEEYDERRKEVERKRWERERRGRERTKLEIEREFRRKLVIRRRQENEECQRRLILARERFLSSQEYLRQLLKDKDERKKKLIETINAQKRALIQQWREREDARRVSVDRAVTELLERDTQYREQLNRMLESKLETVAKRKVKMDKTRIRQIIESNRTEEQEHKRRMEEIEELYARHIEEVRKSIERKLRNAKEIIEESLEKKLRHIKEQAAYRQQDQVLALKAELESGLDLWRKQVLSVQSQSIRKAEEKARAEMNRRREKLAEEIRNREKRYEERRREQRDEIQSRIKGFKEKIEIKEKKVERLLSEREESIARARKMAETSSRLREIIKNQNLSHLDTTELKSVETVGSSTWRKNAHKFTF